MNALKTECVSYSTSTQQVFLNTYLWINAWKTREPFKCNKLHKWTHCISLQTCSMFSISITSTTTKLLGYQINFRVTPGFSNLSITSPTSMSQSWFTPSLTYRASLTNQFFSPAATTAPSTHTLYSRHIKQLGFSWTGQAPSPIFHHVRISSLLRLFEWQTCYCIIKCHLLFRLSLTPQGYTRFLHTHMLLVLWTPL